MALRCVAAIRQRVPSVRVLNAGSIRWSSGSYDPPPQRRPRFCGGDRPTAPEERALLDELPFMSGPAYAASVSKMGKLERFPSPGLSYAIAGRALELVPCLSPPDLAACKFFFVSRVVSQHVSACW